MVILRGGMNLPVGEMGLFMVSIVLGQMTPRGKEARMAGVSKIFQPLQLAQVLPTAQTATILIIVSGTKPVMLVKNR